MAFEVEQFERDVIEASRKQPVLVDFWAPWCGPCRVLGPVLEKLAGEADGAWTLAKVNSDEHPELSARYGIRGIPAVKLFADGQVVDEFTGALPEYAVRQWLEKALPSETRSWLAQAEFALEEGETDQAEALLEAILRAEPTHPAASALMARLVVFDDPDRALALAETAMAAEARYVQMAESVRNLAAVLSAAHGPEQLPDEPGRDAYRTAIEALRAGDFEGAIGSLIQVLQQNRYYADDGARKAGVAIFTLLGDRHPVSLAHRRTFDMWLY
jgi:putative thioredoxin